MKNNKLIFEEHFNQSNTLNSEIWNYEVGEKWANNELQCYTDSPKNLWIENQQLHIMATINPDEKCKYQSARINTFAKKHFQYGKFVVNAKMPKGKGSWPAIWFLGTSMKESHVRWPLCGEIDLVEFAGNKPGSFSSAIHTDAFNHKIGTHKGKRINLPDVSDAFHDYILEWTPEKLVFSIDENPYMTFEKPKYATEREWPYDHPFYLVINLAVGGWYGGAVDDQTFPFELIVNSIKVYE